MIKKTILRLVRKISHLLHFLALRVSRKSKYFELRLTEIISGSNTLKNESETVSVEEIINHHLPQIAPIKPVLPKNGRGPSVSLMLLTVNKDLFFGGVATALITAGITAKEKGYNLRIIQTYKSGEADVGSFLLDNNIEFKGEIEIIDLSNRVKKPNTFLDIHPKDIFIVSAWPDAHIVNQLPLKNKYIYMIQDYEPIFFSNSDERVLAESTYEGCNFIALCNTKEMYDFMKYKNYKKIEKGTFFEPAVSKKIINKSKSKTKRLFIYGRPRVKRNLFYSAIMAVDLFFQDESIDQDEWEVFLAGQDDVPDISFAGNVQAINLGKMNLDKYYEFMSTVDIALSPMMAPHPNYPTLEFASAGASVVTTKYKTKTDLKRYSKNIILTETNIESMKEGLLKASKISRAKRQEFAKDSNVNSDWTKSLTRPVKEVLKQI